jgi:hypothetical protein
MILLSLPGVDTQRVQYNRKKNAAPGSADHDAASGTSAANDDKDSNCSVPNKPLLGRLTDERIRRLEEIGFVWSLRDDWQKVCFRCICIGILMHPSALT